MEEVLFVSKPVAPPWNDSSKNLARDVAGHLRRHVPVLMGRPGQVNPIDRGRFEAVYPASVNGSFTPSLRDNLRVLKRLLLGQPADVWHFFFSPNRKSSAAGWLATAARKVPSVHTVCSMPPEGARWRDLSFADVTVALSRASQDRFRAEGVPASALRLIPPCTPSREVPTAIERARLRRTLGLPESASIWIYPGDLEHGGGAAIALEGFAEWNRADAVLVMACRHKTVQAPVAQARLEAQAKAWGIDARVRWVGQTPRILELLAVSDFVVMVNPTPYAKMDYPLVVLEAMALGRTVVVGQGTPCAELAEDGGAWAVRTNGAALAEGIEGLSSDGALRASIEGTAHALSATRFSPSAVASAYELLYEEIRT
ncbi:MAG: glycosyltransferase family 4 protein [Polyangiales bacterium]